MYACLIPSGLSPPYYISSTTTTITVGWTAPTKNYGCPISEFKLYRDNGGDGLMTVTEGTFTPS